MCLEFSQQTVRIFTSGLAMGKVLECFPFRHISTIPAGSTVNSMFFYYSDTQEQHGHHGAPG